MIKESRNKSGEAGGNSGGLENKGGHPKARVGGWGKGHVIVERAFGAVFEVLSECGGGVKRNSGGGLPSWGREARKLGVFPETFWRLQAPATVREISSWYQLTAARMQHLKSLSPRHRAPLDHQHPYDSTQRYAELHALKCQKMKGNEP